MENKEEFNSLCLDILKKGGSVRFQAHGRSMRPFIKEGDYLTVEPAIVSNIKIGDIILFQGSEGNFAVHRIVKANFSNGRAVFKVKGDSSDFPDRVILPEACLGRVVKIESDGKIISLNSPATRLFSYLIAKFFILPLIWKRIDTFPERIKKISKRNKNNEEYLVKKCLKAFIEGSSNSIKIEDFSLDDFNREKFVRISFENGVIPILHYLFSRQEIKKTIPEEILKQMEEIYYGITTAGILFKEEMSKVISSFNNGGIEFIVLKGMALGMTVYPEFSLRPMSDIDILVRKEDFGRAREKLLEMGYEDQTSGPEDFLKKIAGNIKMDIDLHTGLLNITRIESRQRIHRLDIGKLWDRAVTIEYDGQKYKVFSPEDNLLDLCLHFALHHGFSKFIRAVDIVLLVRHYREQFDWKIFLKESENSKSSRIVYYVLEYVKNIFNIEIPDYVFSALKPKRQTGLEKAIFRYVLKHNPPENFKYLVTFVLLEGFADKTRFLLEAIFPAPEVLRNIYSIPKLNSVFPYYLHHFKRLMNSFLSLGRINQY